MTEIINGTLRMRGDRILLKPLDWDASEAVIAIRHGRPVRGEVIAVGSGIHPVSKRTKLGNGLQRIEFAKRFQPTEVREGDIVELGGLNIFDGNGYQFPEVTVNGVTHLIVTERDVAGIISGAKEYFMSTRTEEIERGALQPSHPWRRCSGDTASIRRRFAAVHRRIVQILRWVLSMKLPPRSGGQTERDVAGIREPQEQGSARTSTS